LPGGNTAGPRWSKKMKGLTRFRASVGSSRRA